MRRAPVTIIGGALLGLVTSISLGACGDDSESRAPTTVQPTPTSSAAPRRAFQSLLDAALTLPDLPTGFSTLIAPEVLSGADPTPGLIPFAGLCQGADQPTRAALQTLNWNVWTTFSLVEPEGDRVIVAEALTTVDPVAASESLATLDNAYRTCVGVDTSEPGSSRWTVEVHGAPPNLGVVSVRTNPHQWIVQTNEFRLVGSTLVVVAVIEERTIGATSCVMPEPPEVGNCRFEPARIDQILLAATARLADQSSSAPPQLGPSASSEHADEPSTT